MTKGRSYIPNPKPKQSENLFIVICDLHVALGLKPLKEMKQWTFKIDDNWSFVINGTEEMQKGAKPEEDMMEIDLPPVHCAVWWNGWIAGLFSPGGGAIAAGAMANAETFTEAVKAAIQRATS